MDAARPSKGAEAADAASDYASKLRAEKARRRRSYDETAPDRGRWMERHRYFYAQLFRHFQLQIPKGARVLHLGSGTGDLLASLEPSLGVGVDLSGEMATRARAKHPQLHFVHADLEALPIGAPFDYIVLSNVIGDLLDVWKAFRQLRSVVRPDTRILISYYNFLWEPVVRLGGRIGWKMPQPEQNWLALPDIANLLNLAGFEVVNQGYRVLFPYGVPLLSQLANGLLARLPGLRRLCLVSHVTARPAPGALLEDAADPDGPSVSVIVPTRNEAGNVAAAVARVPEMGSHTEIVFVDGHSTDGTVEAIEAEIARHAGRKDIRLVHQVPRGSVPSEHKHMLAQGKGHAVRLGFEAARGDVLMILDGDLTVAPEALPMFYAALVERRAEFANGSRLIYELESQSMRTLNRIANKFFGLLFSWALDQRVKDTLCGTKCLRRSDYEKIAANRAYFGDFDPFGDFDLLFGAAKLNLRILDVPIRYQARTYGEIKIQRWRHGLLLIRMCGVAIRKLKLS